MDFRINGPPRIDETSYGLQYYMSTQNLSAEQLPSQNYFRNPKPPRPQTPTKRQDVIGSIILHVCAPPLSDKMKTRPISKISKFRISGLTGPRNATRRNRVYNIACLQKTSHRSSSRPDPIFEIAKFRISGLPDARDATRLHMVYNITCPQKTSSAKLDARNESTNSKISNLRIAGPRNTRRHPGSYNSTCIRKTSRRRCWGAWSISTFRKFKFPDLRTAEKWRGIANPIILHVYR